MFYDGSRLFQNGDSSSLPFSLILAWNQYFYHTFALLRECKIFFFYMNLTFINYFVESAKVNLEISGYGTLPRWTSGCKTFTAKWVDQSLAILNKRYFERNETMYEKIFCSLLLSFNMVAINFKAATAFVKCFNLYRQKDGSYQNVTT